MRFVPVKSDDQLDLQSLHRVDDGSQGKVSADHIPAANSSATNSATVMLNGQRAALGISPRSMRRNVFQCEMPANTVATTLPGLGIRQSG